MRGELARRGLTVRAPAGRRRIFISSLVALLTASSVGLVVSAGATPVTDLVGHCSSGGAGKVSQPGPYAIGSTEVVSLPSDVDGQPIQIGIVHPAVPAGYRSPVIVNASPYITANLNDVDLKSCLPELSDNFVPHGYTVAFVPTRGTSGSGGCADLMGPKERSDLSQAVTWLGKQSWSNGRVGMIGLSYDASTPWDVAATGNRYLKTIVPIEGVNDLPDLVFGGGRNDWRWWFFVAGYYGEYGYSENNPVTSDQDPQVFANSVNCPSLAEGLAATAQAAATGEPESLPYWADRNNRPLVERNYRGSVFLVQGLQDWNVSPGQQFPFVNELAARHVPVKILMGQWNHSWPDGNGLSYPTRRPDFPDMLLAWFDRWLKNDHGVETGPAVEVEDASGQWRTDVAWPSPAATDDVLYGAASGGLAATPADATATAVLAPDQRSRYYFLSDGTGTNTNNTTLPAGLDTTCATCAIFTLPAQDHDVHISGLPSVALGNLVPTGPGAVVSAYLLAVAPDGSAQRLGWGDVDLRFPDGGAASQPVQPGQQMSATVTFQPLEAVVPAGAQLALVLSEGNANHAPTWPRFPVQLTYGQTLVTLHLPVVNPQPSSLFNPPQ